MLVGSLHHDCAYVALMTKDEAKFNGHLEAMSENYRKTRNPWLIRQCEQLLDEARRANMGLSVQVSVAALDGDALAALQGITASGVVTSHGSSLPSTSAEEEAALRPTSAVDLEV
jgi:hypothetical protein